MSRLLAFTFVLLPVIANAQQLDLPRPSLGAKVTQTVGLTDITVDYSSPAVKGRKIFGELVPFGQVWRTGANSATKITFSKDVTIGDKPVPAGTYSLFTVPGRTEWTIVLNKNPNASPRDYKEAEDLLRVTAKPAATASARERMTFIFTDTTEDSTRLDLEWDKLRVSLPIKAKTTEQANAAIKNLEDNAWRPYNNAARYLLESKKDPDRGLALVNKSLGIHEDWFNLWTKAQLLAQKKQFTEAHALAERVNELGKKAEFFFAADEVKKALTEWKK
jgi:hypothetical protein